MATAAPVAAKVAVVAAAATVTDAGTETTEAALLESVTAVSLDGALERVTVQVVEADVTRVVPAHCSADTVGGEDDAAIVRVTLGPVTETARYPPEVLREAVMVAV